MMGIELKKRSTEEMIENLMFEISLMKVQVKQLQKQIEELKNDNSK